MQAASITMHDLKCCTFDRAGWNPEIYRMIQTCGFDVWRGSVWCWLTVLVMLFSLGIANHSANAEEKSPNLSSGAGMSGIGAYVPGQWGVVSSSVQNPTAQDVDLLVVHQFDADPHVQFGTRVWVPNQSIRRVWSAVRPPDAYEADIRQINTQTLLVDDASTTEFQLDRQPGLLLGTTDSPVVALMQDYDGTRISPTVQAMLIGGGHSKRTRHVNPEQAPSTMAGWQAVDALVVDAAAMHFDEAQWVALRQWVLAGGRVWIFYQHDNDEAVEHMQRFLGDDWSVAIVDELPLTQFKMLGSRETLSVQVEMPIAMTRVLASGFTVHHTVRDWPVTLEKQIGRGRVLVSTIGPRAWVKATNGKTSDKSNSKTVGGSDDIGVIATPPLRDIEKLLIDQQLPASAPATADSELVQKLAPYVPTMIGYRVIGRSVVMIMLCAFLILLVIGGIMLHRKNKLEWIATIGGGAAIVAAGILLTLGLMRGREVPTTVASAQLIRVVPGQHQAIVSGVMSLFSASSDIGKVEVNNGGVIWWPDTSAQANKTLRAIWTDLDRWHWDQLTLPPRAVLNATFDNVLNIEEPIVASGQFGPEGLVVDFSPGVLSDLQDPLIATSSGVIVPRDNGKNRYTVGPSQVVHNEQYVRSLSMTREQMRHQSVYQDLLAMSQPDAPTWWIWAKPVDLGFKLIENATHRDWALASVPIKFTAPAPGAARVLSPFLPYTLARSPDGASPVAIYDANNREWIAPLTPGYTIWLRFQLPDSIASAKPTIDELVLTIDMDAPDRDVQLLDPISYGSRALATVSNPRGEAKLSPEDGQASVYQIDSSGGILVGVRVTDQPPDAVTSQWSLQELRLELLLDIPNSPTTKKAAASSTPISTPMSTSSSTSISMAPSASTAKF